MDSGPVIYEQRGRVDEHKSRPDGRRHRHRGQVRISGAFSSELCTDSRSEFRRGYAGRHAREIADARSSTRAIAPARLAPGNAEHLCGMILTERDRVYASKLISLFADCFGLAGRAFVRRVWLHFSARLHANPPLLQILQLGPDWEPMCKGSYHVDQKYTESSSASVFQN